MAAPVFGKPEVGGCSLCGDEETRVVQIRSVYSFGDVDGDTQRWSLNVCDLCAHALRRHWQRALGEVPKSSAPAVSRSYLLVPRLKKGREELDVSSYEFFVTPAGDLPSLAFAKDAQTLASSLAICDLATWPETLRRCYVGYDGAGDFVDVHLAWAWGHVPGTPKRSSWRTFEELLAEVTPRAGFLLGVKAAFESILWRREARPDEERVCVVIREPAMRCVRHMLADDPESLGEDEAMLELCRESVSPDEREILSLLEGAKEEADKKAEEKRARVVSEAAGTLETAFAGDTGGEPPPEGFARRGGLAGKGDDDGT